MLQRMVSLAVFLSLAAGTLPSRENGQHLLNQDEVYRLIKKDKNHSEVIEKTLHDQGVDFDLNMSTDREMKPGPESGHRWWCQLGNGWYLLPFEVPGR